MWINDVCRLCLGKENLLWIYDERFENKENMKDMIFVTTGVEIHTKDIISQKICKKCCEIAIKMFQFRTASLKNDKYLKEKCSTLLKQGAIKIPNTNVTIKAESTLDKPKSFTSFKNNEKPRPILRQGEKFKERPNILKSEPKPDKAFAIHPSVQNLFRVYPEIKLPKKCLDFNISPCVSMKMNEVENYFQAKNIDIKEHSEEAIKSYKRFRRREQSAASKQPTSGSGASTPTTFEKIPEKDEKDNLKSIKIKSIYTFIPNQNDVNGVSQVKCLMEDHLIPEIQRKRKVSETFSDTSEDSRKGKMFRQMDNSSPLCIDKSIPLFICDICNSVQYTSKDLSRHKQRHMRCQFCKLRFKDLISKSAHVESSCPIKNIMNNLPVIELSKVEFNLEARREFPNAFVNFKPIPGLEISRRKKVEVIEILSDDEESKGHVATPLAIPKKTESDVPNQSNPVSAVPQVSPALLFESVSVVRPDIRINNNTLIDHFDTKCTDIKILKDLLTFNKAGILCEEKFTQTEFPSSESIIVSVRERTATLRSLKEYLRVFRIPVTIQHGSFKVRYRDYKPIERQRKLLLWNDLTPTDIKTSDAIEKESENDAAVHGEIPLPALIPISEASRVQTGFVSAPLSTTSAISAILRESFTNSINSEGTSGDSPKTIHENPLLNAVLDNRITPNPKENPTVCSSSNVVAVPAKPLVLNSFMYPPTLSTFVPSVNTTLITSPSSLADVTPVNTPATTVTSTSAIEPMISTPQVPMIRVKNFWELT